MKKYKSFYKMTKDICSHSFIKLFYIYLFTKHTCPIDPYQDLFRIYLDEYPKQEKLRADYFQRKEELNLMVKSIVTVCNLGVSYQTTNDNLFYRFEVKDEIDPYFYSRWLKRN